MRARGTLIVFVKSPVAGRAKSRLGQEIGLGRAAAIFRHLTATTLVHAAKSGAPLMIAIDPPSDLYGWRSLWPQRFRRLPQAQGSLGERMRGAMRAADRGPVVIIGADAPALRAHHLRHAFHALGAADAVFGPAADGGYWLVGLARRRAAPGALLDVRWSTAHALADSIASLPRDFRIDFLPVLGDIDHAADLSAAGPLLRSAR